MTSSMEMGDIYWVTNNSLATTHKSGRDGYLQYCGVADGRYLFRESIAPDGYKQMADVKFTLSSGPDSVYQPTDEFPALEDAKGVSLGTDSQITGLVENLDGEYVHIKNYAKGMWPVTGGIGALVVFAIGGVLMTSALVKRRHDNKN
ncbi:SpaA isopeptide-forming pilin-related protein [Weissella sp. LMG 11983]|nr:SpaA isopeptide-forming pilin-related protein [Weissella sp. LMG 11983]MCW0926685.1 SpaA isopeptide-forming pilin-related protein [Weissella sp. LMG 11983]